MSRGKPIQQGVRVKLPQGVTWSQIASMTPDEIKRRNVFPEGFMPLPHPNHPEGGMVFKNSGIALRLRACEESTSSDCSDHSAL